MTLFPIRPRTWIVKAAVFAFTISLLANSAFAAPESLLTLTVSMIEIGRDARFTAATHGFGNNLGLAATNLLSISSTGKAHDIPELSRIEIVQGTSATIRQGEPVDLVAIGYAADGRQLGGIRFDWSIEKVGSQFGPRNLPNGVFKASRPGSFLITASAGGLAARIRVRVDENRALMLLRKVKEQESRGDFELSNRLRQAGSYSTTDISSKREYRGEASPEPNVETPIQNGEHGPSAERLEPAPARSHPLMMMRPADDDGWGNGNWWQADDPGNGVGDPPGTSPDAGAGNGNFQLAVPVVSLPGRGIDVNLSLNYNSRVWSKSTSGSVTTMSFDAERGNPAPGWNVGFGKMMYMGSSGGCMLIDPDGTNHGYTGTISNYSSGGYTSVSFTGHTTDGTFIDYGCWYSAYNGSASLGGSSQLPNGSWMAYGSSSVGGKQCFPTAVTDAQGNYINISYRNSVGPQLNTVTDTLGRVISFSYDAYNRLISIEVPKFNNAGSRTAVRLHYHQLTLSPGWAAGILSDTNNPAPYVIDAIYYPGTGKGYWFGADAAASDYASYYSSYGMLAKITEQRGMNWSGTAGDQGVITAGAVSKQAVYDYPLAADYTLTDAPTYSTQTETWDGMDTAAAVTTYAISMNSNPRTITVTQPNGVKSKQYMYNAPGLWNDGLIYQDQTLDGSNNQLGKSVVTWQQGAYDSPRPSQTEITDEKLQVLKTTYTYGTSYNQLTSQKKYDYDGTTPLKELRNTYENSVWYTGRHIFSLVKTSETYDGVGTRIAKTDYEYDDNAVVTGPPAVPNLKATPGVGMHYSNADPYTTETTDGSVCATYHYETSWCDDGSGWQYQCYVDVCDSWEQVSVYAPSTIFRGNLTKTTVYADASPATPLQPTVQTKQYDVTGNPVAETASCCELKTYDFTLATQYAYPTTKVRGSSDASSGLKNTVTGMFDFNTGLMTQSTDANGKTVTTTFDVDSLRPTQTMSSTGAYSTSVYDDAAMTIANEMHAFGGALANKNTTYLNGLGKSKKEEALVGSVTDIVETKYTNQGQVWKSARPYRTGDTVQWQEIVYDLLGRTSQVIEPDGSASKGYYNETTVPAGASASPGETFRSVDAWGRERWERKDALGHMVEVLEPKVDGTGAFAASGNLATTYTFNVLDRITQSNQGGQIRSFKYDSLGRMTRQKLAEQTATLNDNGQYVGSGGSGATWGAAVAYDDRSNIIQKVDARGVIANYSYQLNSADDPLNRIQGISYDLSGSHDTSKPIAPAPSVSYEYMTTGDQARIKKITTAGNLTEDFAYDSEGRINEYTQTLANRTSYPLATTYTYDSLDRVVQVRQPAQYGLAGNPRKLTETSYDAANRLSTFKVDGELFAWGISYNASSQITSLKIGALEDRPYAENYTFDSSTGLLTNQTVSRGRSTLMDITYDYARNNSVGNTNVSWKTGAVTKILNNLDHNKDREYQFDAVGRLTVAKGKASNQWIETYVYDRFGNRTGVTASGTAADGITAIPTDGIGSLSYSSSTNRITTNGYEYDVAGNQTRAIADDGVTWVKYEYDAANRLQIVRKDDSGQTLLQSFQYGSGNAKLIDYNATTAQNTIAVNIGGKTTTEYTEFTANTPTWARSNIYLGSRQLASITPNGTGGENREYNHPDKLGTRLVTNPIAGTAYEQAHLPFGTALNAESTITTNPKRFTSYERSSQTGLDYAQNRTYDSKQGRFTQVDPLGMAASSLSNPQSLNMYSYVGNDPVNRTDPTGLFWGWLKSLFKAILRILLVIAIVVAVLIVAALVPGLVSTILQLAAFAIGAIFRFKLISEFLGSIKEWLHRCNVPDYAGLSQARRDELSQRGVTPDQWNALRNNQRLGYFNIVAAIAAAGLSLIGWLVDWAAGGIQQDRTFFRRGPGGANLLAQVKSSSIFSPDKGGGSLHGAYSSSFRLNTFTRSTQLSFTPDGDRLDADIDIFNPNRFLSFFGHIFEVLAHTLGHIFGGGSRTNPYNVGYRSSWECK